MLCTLTQAQQALVQRCTESRMVRNAFIAYASRGLSQCKARYPAHKLEFLALKWAITEKFHDYLYGNNFTVITDSNPLWYILTKAKLDATSYRWLAALSAYTFDIKYRATKIRTQMDCQGGHTVN